MAANSLTLSRARAKPMLVNRVIGFLPLIVLAVFLLLMFFPLVIVVINSLKTEPEYYANGPLALPQSLNLSTIISTWNRTDYTTKLINSIYISLSVAVLATVLSLFNAFALGIGRVRGRTWLLLFFLLAITLPNESLAYPLYYFFKQIKLYDTQISVILVSAAFNSAYGTYLLSSVFSSFNREILEAAHIDGCNKVQLLYRIVVPLSWPSLSVLFVFFFIWTWNDFFLPLILLVSNSRQTVPVAIALAQGEHNAVVTTQSAAALLGILPCIIFFILFQRTLARGVTAGSLNEFALAQEGDFMKFDKGAWLLLPGTEAIYPATIVNVLIESDALVVTGYNHVVRSRNDMLDGTLITARFTSPLPDVIRIQLTHFKGRREHLPAFDLDYGLTNAAVSIGQDQDHAWLDAGRLSVVVPTHGDWRISYRRDDQLLTASEPHSVGLFSQGGKTYLREQLALQPGETVYGLGEHFGPVVKNGQALEMWNEDGGTNSEYAYKNVPFYLTSRGYGVLVNHPGDVSFEVGSHHVERVQFSAEGHSLDYYLFGGPTMKDALEQYTALSGRPALPPDWSFGLWLSTSFTTNYNEYDILANIERMEALGIPISVFHFDCFWMKELTWCSLLWDERNFPDPAAMLRQIKDKGIKICLWMNPYVAEASPLFAEGAAQGYLLRTPDGDVYQVDKWQPGQGFVDFTNPAARAWYAGKLKALLDMGVDAFKTDFGERIPTEVRYFDGSDPQRMHNYYTYLYNQTVFELLREVKGEGEAVVFARSATTGSQKFPAHWGGDNSSSYPSMAETLRGGLSLGLSGFGFWSHDISGFNDTASPDLYKRWVAFGLLSSHSRLHGNTSARMPWLFDDEAIDVLRFFNGLKTHLLPYLLDAAREAHEHGWPVLRAMVLEFPDDPNCRYLDMQYMLGSALLVAPVFNANCEAAYYLPEGLWRNLLTGEVAQGNVWRKEQHSYLSLPLWVNMSRGSAWECLQGYSVEQR